MNPIEEWTDAFENQVSGRTNVLDLAAHYSYSPERWRLFVNGSRAFPEYGSVAQYTHSDDTHDLQPAGGDTVVFESAERPRYVVQYELAATWAFAVNQSLQGNDQLKIGLYDGSDGWYLEHRGDHADTEADFVLERAGSEVYRETNQDLHKTVQTFARLKLQTGWYDVTRQVWERSYSDGGSQVNATIGKFSADDSRGSRTGNLPLHYEITADASTTGLVLHAGSAAQVNLGTTTPLTREKVSEHTHTFATTGSWVPLLALRVDPDRDITNVQLEGVHVLEWGGSGDVNLVAKSHAPQNVLNGSGVQLSDSDFVTPGQQSPTSSVVETSTAVDQAADDTGTPTTSTASTGGYQIGWATQRTSGAGSKTTVSGSQSDVKAPIYGQDVVVIWGNADNAADVVYEIQTEQDF